MEDDILKPVSEETYFSSILISEYECIQEFSVSERLLIYLKEKERWRGGAQREVWRDLPATGSLFECPYQLSQEHSGPPKAPSWVLDSIICIIFCCFSAHEQESGSETPTDVLIWTVRVARDSLVSHTKMPDPPTDFQGFLGSGSVGHHKRL